MTLPPKLYDLLKWAVLVFLPATTTLVSVVGAILGWGAEVLNAVITIMTAGTVWLGAIIGIASATHKAEEKK